LSLRPRTKMSGVGSVIVRTAAWSTRATTGAGSTVEREWGQRVQIVVLGPGRQTEPEWDKPRDGVHCWPEPLADRRD
jgi:hypothetical protein